MTYTKRIFAALLCLVFLIGCIPAVSENADSSEWSEVLPPENPEENIDVAAEPIPEPALLDEVPQTDAETPAGNPPAEAENAFDCGYALILPDGASVYESAARVTPPCAELASGVVYAISRSADDADSLEIAYLTNADDEIRTGWIDPSCVRPLDTETEVPAYLAECVDAKSAVFDDVTVFLLPAVLTDPTAEEAPDDALTGILLTGPQTIGLKEKAQLRVQPIPADAKFDLTYKFKSSKSSYVSVQSDGQITGAKRGTATITVTASNGMTASLKVTVKKAPTSVTLSIPRTVLGVGESVPTSFKLSSGSASSAIKYATEVDGVVAIDENGVVTALKEGTVRIKCIAFNKKSSNILTIEVKSAPKEIIPEADKLTISEGDSHVLGYEFGENQAGAVEFSSSDPDVASVDADGKISALKKGTAFITLTPYNHACSATCEVTVTGEPTGLTLYGAQTIGVGETTQLTTKIEPEDAVSGVTFTSGNSKVATVSKSGVVTGKKAGTATIYAETYNHVPAELELTVKKAPTSVKLSIPRTVLGVDESVPTSYTLSSGSAGDVTKYVTDVDGVVSIDENGVVTAIGEGSARIKCYTYNNKASNILDLEVKSAPREITVEPTKLTLGKDDSYALDYEFGENQAGAVEFTSSDPDVASVDEDGTITALKKGTAFITLTPYNHKCSATCEVTVDDAPTALSLFGTSTIGVGETAQLTTEIEPAGLTGSITFTSGNSKVATVSKSGVVTGKKAGSVTIFAETYNHVVAELKLTVKKAPSSVKLSIPRKVLGVNESVQTSYTLSDGSAGSVTKYLTDVDDVVAVDENGMITALDEGEVRIKCYTYNNKVSNILNLEVKSAPSEITVEPTELTLGADDSYVLGYTLGEDEAGAVEFASSDPDVVSVDEDGKITALKKGTAVITLTPYNHECSATCEVTVVDAPTAITLIGPSSIGVGESVQFTAEMSPEDTVSALTFASSKTSYATVSKSGVVTGKKAGATNISVKTYNGQSDKIAVTVKKAPTSVKLSIPRTVLGVNESVPTSYTLSSGSAGRVTKYVTDVDGVVAIDENGVVTAIGEGSVRIKCYTYNGKPSNILDLEVRRAPTEITPDAAELMIGEGDSYILGYTLGEGEAGAVEFTSSNPDVASVDADGKISALKKGTAVITLTPYNHGCSATCTVTVAGEPTAITLNGPKTIGVGEAVQFTTAIEPEGLTSSLKFASSNNSYASVSKSGVVTGKKAGTTTISVETYNHIPAELEVTVKKAPTSVKLSIERTVLGLQESLPTSCTLSGGSAGHIADYFSNDESVVTIDENGVVTATGIGETEIGCHTYNGVRSNLVTIEVKNMPQSLSLSEEYLTLGAEGDSTTLTASLNEGSAGAIYFNSSDPDIAAVNADGVIETLVPGTATITVSTYVPGIEAECVVTVLPAPDSVSLPSPTLRIGLGDTIQLEPQIPEGTATHFAYKTSKSAYVAVNSGGQISGKAIGSSVVTVSTHNGKTCSVTVYCDKAPSSVAFEVDQINLGIGERRTPGVKLPPSSAATLTFISYDPEIASVDASGEITGLAVGNATIEVTTYNNKSATCTVSVFPAPTGISLNYFASSLGVGQTLQLESELFPAGSSSSITYSVITGSSVSVTQDGLVTAEKTGSAIVCAKTYLDSVYADCAFTVYPAPSSISFDSMEYVLNVGETLQLEPKIPAGTMTQVTYSIKKEGYFTIDENGLLKAISRGTTTVTATTHNGKSATVTVQVMDPNFPESASFSVTPPTKMEIGDVFKPKLTIVPSTGILDMQWKSSDASVLKVDAVTGQATALSYGKAKVTGTSARNPSIVLAYSVTVVSSARCLTMPKVRKDVSGKSGSQIKTVVTNNQAEILKVRNSAFMELSSLEADGTITTYDSNWRTTVINRAFNMAIFPWITTETAEYWKEANDENGRKKFQPGILYFGLPYTQNNRNFDEKKVVSSGYYTKTDYNYYKLNNSKFKSRMYAGNDCSSFVSICQWGIDSSNAGMSSSQIGSSTLYSTISDSTKMRPGDVIWKSGHVMLFLYYTNAAHTQFCVIEQGGDGGSANDYYTNTIACTIKTEFKSGWKVRRPKH